MLLLLVFVISLIAGICLHLLLGLQIWQCLLLFFLGFLGLGGLRPMYKFLKNLPRDLIFLAAFLKLTSAFKKLIKDNATVPKCFQQVVSKYPNKTAILFEDQKWTFQELDAYSNRVAAFLLNNGFKRGDCIALFMTNCPQYAGIVIGAFKVGVEVALINSNLRNKGLFHCINIAECSGIMYEGALEEALGGISDQFSEQLQRMCFCCLSSPLSVGRSFDSEIEQQPSNPIPLLKEQSFQDVACYIYTSGTTGLPKAVPITHRRFLSMVLPFKITLPIGIDDIIYDPLPLYHTNGGILAMGQCYVGGVTVALRRKFSASQFIADCIKYKCTIFCYIGELCRYILLQPPAETDTQHSIVKCFGNGLRPDIWKDFQKRFAISKIIEFYGSTEGTVVFFNLIGKPGAIGYYSFWVKPLLKILFLKVDAVSGEIVRNSKGFCVEVPPGEEGEMVRAIYKYSKFNGYKDTTATSKKILRDVFKKGDSYFRTGDVARVDEDGYVYFCDRIGDTFRWKGENVSTTEIENTIGSLIGHKDTVVYGVEIPRMEGRAGMAAIVGTAESIGIAQLASQLKKVLPSYAVPLFIRLVDSSRLTGTFKFQKVEYRKEGFDGERVSDKLFVLDPDQKMYVPLTKEMNEKIVTGKVRL